MNREIVLDDSYFLILEEGRDLGLVLTDEQIAAIQRSRDEDRTLSIRRSVEEFAKGLHAVA